MTLFTNLQSTPRFQVLWHEGGGGDGTTEEDNTSSRADAGVTTPPHDDGMDAWVVHLWLQNHATVHGHRHHHQSMINNSNNNHSSSHSGSHSHHTPTITNYQPTIPMTFTPVVSGRMTTTQNVTQSSSSSSSSSSQLDLALWLLQMSALSSSTATKSADEEPTTAAVVTTEATAAMTATTNRTPTLLSMGGRNSKGHPPPTTTSSSSSKVGNSNGSPPTPTTTTTTTTTKAVSSSTTAAEPSRTNQTPWWTVPGGGAGTGRTMTTTNTSIVHHHRPLSSSSSPSSSTTSFSLTTPSRKKKVALSLQFHSASPYNRNAELDALRERGLTKRLNQHFATKQQEQEELYEKYKNPQQYYQQHQQQQQTQNEQENKTPPHSSSLESSPAPAPKNPSEVDCQEGGNQNASIMEVRNEENPNEYPLDPPAHKHKPPTKEPSTSTPTPPQQQQPQQQSLPFSEPDLSTTTTTTRLGTTQLVSTGRFQLLHNPNDPVTLPRPATTATLPKPNSGLPLKLLAPPGDEVTKVSSSSSSSCFVPRPLGDESGLVSTVLWAASHQIWQYSSTCHDRNSNNNNQNHPNEKSPAAEPPLPTHQLPLTTTVVVTPSSSTAAATTTTMTTKNKKENKEKAKPTTKQSTPPVTTESHSSPSLRPTNKQPGGGTGYGSTRVCVTPVYSILTGAVEEEEEPPRIATTTSTATTTTTMIQNNNHKGNSLYQHNQFGSDPRHVSDWVKINAFALEEWSSLWFIEYKNTTPMTTVTAMTMATTTNQRLPANLHSSNEVEPTQAPQSMIGTAAATTMKKEFASTQTKNGQKKKPTKQQQEQQDRNHSPVPNNKRNKNNKENTLLPAGWFPCETSIDTSQSSCSDRRATQLVPTGRFQIWHDPAEPVATTKTTTTTPVVVRQQQPPNNEAATKLGTNPCYVSSQVQSQMMTVLEESGLTRFGLWMATSGTPTTIVKTTTAKAATATATKANLGSSSSLRNEDQRRSAETSTTIPQTTQPSSPRTITTNGALLEKPMVPTTTIPAPKPTTTTIRNTATTTTPSTLLFVPAATIVSSYPSPSVVTPTPTVDSISDCGCSIVTTHRFQLLHDPTTDVVPVPHKIVKQQQHSPRMDTNPCRHLCQDSRQTMEILASDETGLLSLVLWGAAANNNKSPLDDPILLQQAAAATVSRSNIPATTAIATPTPPATVVAKEEEEDDDDHHEQTVVTNTTPSKTPSFQDKKKPLPPPQEQKQDKKKNKKQAKVKEEKNSPSSTHTTNETFPTTPETNATTKPRHSVLLTNTDVQAMHHRMYESLTHVITTHRFGLLQNNSPSLEPNESSSSNVTIVTPQRAVLNRHPVLSVDSCCTTTTMQNWERPEWEESGLTRFGLWAATTQLPTTVAQYANSVPIEEEQPQHEPANPTTTARDGDKDSTKPTQLPETPVVSDNNHDIGAARNEATITTNQIETFTASTDQPPEKPNDDNDDDNEEMEIVFTTCDHDDDDDDDEDDNVTARGRSTTPIQSYNDSVTIPATTTTEEESTPVVNTVKISDSSSVPTTASFNGNKNAQKSPALAEKEDTIPLSSSATAPNEEVSKQAANGTKTTKAIAHIPQDTEDTPSLDQSTRNGNANARPAKSKSTPIVEKTGAPSSDTSTRNGNTDAKPAKSNNTPTVEKTKDRSVKPETVAVEQKKKTAQVAKSPAVATPTNGKSAKADKKGEQKTLVAIEKKNETPNNGKANSAATNGKSAKLPEKTTEPKKATKAVNMEKAKTSQTRNQGKAGNEAPMNGNKPSQRVETKNAAVADVVPRDQSRTLDFAAVAAAEQVQAPKNLESFSKQQQQPQQIVKPPESTSFNAATTTQRPFKGNHEKTSGNQEYETASTKASTRATTVSPVKTNRAVKVLNAPTTVSKKSKRCQSDITVFGATNPVAKHVLKYLLESSEHHSVPLKLTIAGTNETQLTTLQRQLLNKDHTTANSSTNGNWKHDTKIRTKVNVFVLAATARSDKDKVRTMVANSKVVLNCASKVSDQYHPTSEEIVAECAKCGTDYVDIANEVQCISTMREKFGQASKASGARIIPLCGFESLPSDLATFMAVEALKRKSRKKKPMVDNAYSWIAESRITNQENKETRHPLQEIPFRLQNCLFRTVPLQKQQQPMMEDPMILCNPAARNDVAMNETKTRLAWAERWNQIPLFHSFLKGGASMPSPSSTVNTKLVHASAVSLNYGPNFTYYERYLPLGFQGSIRFRILSIFAALLFQIALFVCTMLSKLPLIGSRVAEWRSSEKPGKNLSDSSDNSLQECDYLEVYTEVQSESSGGGITGIFGRKMNKANVYLKFQGAANCDVSAQCVCEAVLCLLLDKENLPRKSDDGFGTPAEIIGKPLFKRLTTSSVRPVQSNTNVRMATDPHEWRIFF